MTDGLNNQQNDADNRPTGFELDQLVARLRRQAALADELVELAGGQAACIADGEADRLLSLLEKRQAAIDELLTLQEELTPLTERLQQKSDHFSEPRCVQARSLIELIQMRLAEIAEIDNTDRTALQGRLDELTKEKQLNGTVRTARQAYFNTNTESAKSKTAPAKPRFTDQQG